ncbi:MAG: dihydroneopterin aldolase [Chloroflexi bacterium]|nr:MAG: dihydroneopterin aldolase [Chloroflexota bacterium]
MVRRRPAGKPAGARIAAPEAPPPGRITVAGIVARGRHGVSDEERSRTQPFEVDVSAIIDVAQAATTDDLSATVNYAALQELVMTRVGASSVHLLETLAASIGQAVLERWSQITSVEVAVRKPEASMPGPFSKVEVRVRLPR